MHRGTKGMISLMDKQEIILSHFRDGKSQWDIYRETGIDRKTIRKYIRESESKKQSLLNSKKEDKELISDIVTIPKYYTSSRIRRKLIDEIIERIHFFLKENEIKKATGEAGTKRKRLNNI